jgi:biofilm protein TabA
LLIGYLDFCQYQIKNQNNDHLNKVVETIKKTDFFSMEDGTYELEGKELYYHLLSYDTKEKIDKQFLEMHKKYIDFFYILNGKETIRYIPNDGSYIYGPNYDPDKDTELIDTELIEDLSSESLLIFEKGMFAIFLPGELHMSGIIAGKSMAVRKLIFKVLFN